ncbi:MAG TPA: hypothetical protein ENI70_00580, partial [Candidatus Peregrinibacteria bacterium]|nr:hypothetical protein [Candidatus Peregrinibacteria bacterium]
MKKLAMILVVLSLVVCVVGCGSISTERQPFVSTAPDGPKDVFHANVEEDTLLEHLPTLGIGSPDDFEPGTITVEKTGEGESEKEMKFTEIECEDYELVSAPKDDPDKAVTLLRV